MRVNLSWRDTNFGESESRIYRGSAPLDPQALPAPYATVGPGVSSYLDENVTDQSTYYYRVGVMVNGQEYLGEELEMFVDAAAAMPVDDLLSFYTLDSTQDATLVDLGPLGNDATLVGAYSAVSSPRGGAVSFDSAAGGHASLGNMTELDGLPEFSISVWAKYVGTFSDDQAIFSQWGGTSDGGILLWFDNSASSGATASRTVAFMYDPEAADFGRVNGTTDAVTPGQWHHIVGVFDGPNGRARLYIDNVLVREVTSGVPAVTNAALGGPVYIAATQANAMESRTVEVDQLRLYTRALTATDVDALYGEAA